MKRSALSLALLGLLVVPGLESSRSVQAAAKPSQDQEQALVQAHKNWSKQTHNQRLELMQRSQRCVDGAHPSGTLRTAANATNKPGGPLGRTAGPI